MYLVSQDLAQQLRTLLPQNQDNVELVKLLFTPLPANFNNLKHLEHKEQVLLSRFQTLNKAGVFDRELTFLRDNYHQFCDEDCEQNQNIKQNKEKENIEAAWRDDKLLSMLKMTSDEECKAIDQMLANNCNRWKRCPASIECKLHKKRRIYIEQRVATLFKRLRLLRKNYRWARVKYIAKFYGRQVKEHFMSPLNCLLTTWLVCFCFSIAN